jgi:hypothetical protein
MSPTSSLYPVFQEEMSGLQADRATIFILFQPSMSCTSMTHTQELEVAERT